MIVSEQLASGMEVQRGSRNELPTKQNDASRAFALTLWTKSNIDFFHKE